jgi:hypothetical protein
MQRHRCFDAVDAKIKAKNRKLSTDPEFPNALHVETVRIRSLRQMDDCPPVIAAFCPFCGEVLDVKATPERTTPRPTNLKPTGNTDGDD